jgi:hypothetical protein
MGWQTDGYTAEHGDGGRYRRNGEAPSPGKRHDIGENGRIHASDLEMVETESAVIVDIDAAH